MKGNYFMQIQKYFPYILIALTILIGGYISIQRGIIRIPSLGEKTNVVVLDKTSTVDILFTGGEYKLSYSGLDPANIVNIAKFNKTEQWQGLGSLDKKENSIGGTVLSLTDRDREGASTYLLTNIDLSSIDTIKFSVTIDTDINDFESLNLLMGNKEMTAFYRFPITNLVKGTNYISIPKYRFMLTGSENRNVQKNDKKTSVTSTAKPSLGWDKIERVELELFSRPDAKVTVDVGWIRGEKDDLFSADWGWDNQEHFLNLDLGQDGKPVLLVKNVGRSIATLKKVGSVKDFTYSAKITSLKRGIIGLFVRGNYQTTNGYYLSVGGAGTNDWSISKYGVEDDKPKTTILLKGQIANFEFANDKPFWLKVTAKSNSIIASLSLDGKSWTKLGSVTDNEFESGGVGVAVSAGAAGYFDEFYLSS